MIDFRSALPLVALLTSFQLQAYNMGLKFGATVTQHKITNSMGQRFGTQSMGLGYVAGLFWQNSDPGWGYEVGLFYSHRTSVPSTLEHTDIIYKLSNLELPILLRYEFESVYLGLGAYFKHGLGKVQIDGGRVIPASDYNYGQLKLHSWEAGAVCAVGSKFDTGMGVFTLETRFNFGLTNRARSPSGQTAFESWSYDIMAGVAF